MKTQARIVVVGGGALGCSIAYHLGRMGENDVLVLEKSQLTHGATWHAAGLVGQLRSKRNLTRLMQDSVEVCERLTEETGQETGWRQVGSLRIASSEERWKEIKRTATTARSFGFELNLLSAQEALDMFPYMSTEGVVGAAFVPSDGYIDPYSYTMALAAGAKQNGVTFKENVLVEGVMTEGRRITGVHTSKGDVACEILVNAAGLWARHMGKMMGLDLPTSVVEHQYCVTDKSQDIPSDLPTLRDPDKNFYLKPEVGGLVIGGWEQGARSVGDELSFDFGQELFEGNFDRFENIILPAAERIPLLNEVGIQTLINGPIPVSADGEPIMGPAPEFDNLFLACGFTAGIAASGGAGLALARWIIEGDPGMDLWSFDARRFGKHHGGGAYLRDRCVEVYDHYYKIHYPALEMSTARGGRRSPLYSHLHHQGACYGSKFGWERPNFFWPDKKGRNDEPLSFSRDGWMETVGEEHKAVRERVAVIDQSSFSKFAVTGSRAFKYLQWLAANDLEKEPGWSTYTQLCNERGGIEADLTIVRRTENDFYVVTGSGFGVRDRHWIESHMPRDGSVSLTDITSSLAVINLCGPSARHVLEAVAEDDVSNVALPFLSAREIRIGYAPVLAMRISYVGEQGWELHMPVEYAKHVYLRLKDAGADFGIADVGYRAIDSLRMEKRYLYWGADIGPDYSPYEAGLGFCVKPNKGDFLGRDALLDIKERGVSQKLCVFLLDEPAPLYGSEAIYHDGKVVGVTTSGNFGYTVGKSIAFGYVPSEIASDTSFEVEAYAERYSATRIDGCAYDPKRSKIIC